MKRRILLGFLITINAMLFTSCVKSPTAPNATGNLIQNSTFLSGGSPSLAGWVVNDTSAVRVVSNAPSGSTALSIALEPAVGPFGGGVAATYATGESGTHIYTLSAWERNYASWYWGTMQLSQIRNGRTIAYKAISAYDSTWTRFTLSDTLDMLSSDSLAVVLGAPSVSASAHRYRTASVDTVTGGVLFNQLQLTRGE